MEKVQLALLVHGVQLVDARLRGHGADDIVLVRLLQTRPGHREVRAIPLDELLHPGPSVHPLPSRVSRLRARPILPQDAPRDHPLLRRAQRLPAAGAPRDRIPHRCPSRLHGEGGHRGSRRPAHRGRPRPCRRRLRRLRSPRAGRRADRRVPRLRVLGHQRPVESPPRPSARGALRRGCAPRDPRRLSAHVRVRYQGERGTR